MGLTMFQCPKKNKTIWIVISFHQLNRVLKQKEYPLPMDDEMFQNISGFVFASVIDHNMRYLSIPLTEPTQKLLTIVATFGFFKCFVLLMGIKPVIDIFQMRMIGIFKPLEKHKQKPYIDGIFNGRWETFDKHLLILKKFFQTSRNAGQPGQE